MTAKTLVSLAAVVALAAAPRAFACECGWVSIGEDGQPHWADAPPLEEKDLQAVEAVFLGRVTAVREAALGDQGILKTVVTVDVERYWVGKVARHMTIYGGFGIDCAFPFEVGKRYVVFAARFGKADRRSLGVAADALLAKECSRTVEIDAAGDLIERLERFRRGDTPSDAGASSNLRPDQPVTTVTTVASATVAPVAPAGRPDR